MLLLFQGAFSGSAVADEVDGISRGVQNRPAAQQNPATRSFLYGLEMEYAFDLARVVPIIFDYELYFQRVPEAMNLINDAVVLDSLRWPSQVLGWPEDEKMALRRSLNLADHESLTATLLKTHWPQVFNFWSQQSPAFRRRFWRPNAMSSDSRNSVFQALGQFHQRRLPLREDLPVEMRRILGSFEWTDDGPRATELRYRSATANIIQPQKDSRELQVRLRDNFLMLFSDPKSVGTLRTPLLHLHVSSRGMNFQNVAALLNLKLALTFAETLSRAQGETTKENWTFNPTGRRGYVRLIRADRIEVRHHPRGGRDGTTYQVEGLFRTFQKKDDFRTTGLEILENPQRLENLIRAALDSPHPDNALEALSQGFSALARSCPACLTKPEHPFVIRLQTLMDEVDGQGNGKRRFDTALLLGHLPGLPQQLQERVTVALRAELAQHATDPEHLKLYTRVLIPAVNHDVVVALRALPREQRDVFMSRISHLDAPVYQALAREWYLELNPKTIHNASVGEMTQIWAARNMVEDVAIIGHLLKFAESPSSGIRAEAIRTLAQIPTFLSEQQSGQAVRAIIRDWDSSQDLRQEVLKSGEEPWIAEVFNLDLRNKAVLSRPEWVRAFESPIGEQLQRLLAQAVTHEPTLLPNAIEVASQLYTLDPPLVAALENLIEQYPQDRHLSEVLEKITARDRRRYILREPAPQQSSNTAAQQLVECVSNAIQ